jgi:hypothetical protein
MALALADESGLSRNCAEVAGLPPTTPKGQHDKSIVSERVNRPNRCMMMMMTMMMMLMMMMISSPL